MAEKGSDWGVDDASPVREIRGKPVAAFWSGGTSTGGRPLLVDGATPWSPSTPPGIPTATGWYSVSNAGVGWLGSFSLVFMSVDNILSLLIAGTQ